MEKRSPDDSLVTHLNVHVVGRQTDLHANGILKHTDAIYAQLVSVPDMHNPRLLSHCTPRDERVSNLIVGHTPPEISEILEQQTREAAAHGHMGPDGVPAGARRAKRVAELGEEQARKYHLAQLGRQQQEHGGMGGARLLFIYACWSFHFDYECNITGGY